MSLGSCLPGLQEEGKITPDQAAEAREIYDELLAEYAASGTREAAEALASRATLDALERNVARREFLAALTIKRRQALLRDLRAYKGDIGDARFATRQEGDGPPILPNSAKALIGGRDPHARFASVEGRRMAIVADAHRELDQLMADHAAGLRGQMRNPAQMQDIVRELFGEASGNGQAKALAEAWRRTSERLRQRFNAAGGDIGFRADWGLPQAHDWQLVRKAGFAEWRDFIAPKLDRSKMIDARTGRPFSDGTLDDVLRDVWETIRSDGTADMTPGAAGGKALANRRGDARFLAFKSAEDWATYQQRFGTVDAYTAMMGHVDGMARDIAALEVLGPNPESTLRWVQDTVLKSAGLDTAPGSKAVESAKTANRAVGRMWDEYRGAHQTVDNEWLALGFSAIRSWEVATKLGGAALAATSDFAFKSTRTRFNKLARSVGMPGYLSLMKPGSAEWQKFAVRRGLIAEEWASRTAGQSRFFLEELTGAIPRTVANGILRVSGLNRHTQSIRWVYGMETLATFTEQAGKAFDELAIEHRSALQRYGIGADDWNQLRSAPMDTDRGIEWISPHNVEDRHVAARFMEMLHTEKNVAVITGDIETRAAFNAMLPKGTMRGELGRSGMQFMTFGLTAMLSQGRQVASMNAGSAAKYAGYLIITTTLMGALAIQLKQIAQGKDPRPMGDANFWLAAMMQGGGFGIYGDFLFSAIDRGGRGLEQRFFGPAVSDTISLVNLAKAKDPRKSAVKTAKQFVPGNNLWYSRLATDRLIADQIDEMVNPDIRNTRRRLDRFAAEQGTAYWWEPGDTRADRAPDYLNALEEGPQE